MKRQTVTNKKPRRGIVLLVVLSLLTLFALLMVTFLVISGQYQNTAIATSRIGQVGDHPRKLLDSGMYQVLRGTRDSKSVIQGHDLLSDMYGLTGFTGSISGAGSPGTFLSQPDGTADQFIEVRVPDSLVRDIVFRSGFPLSRTNGYYNGQVMTFTSGTAHGLSLRIVGYTYTGGNGFFRLLRPSSDRATNVSLTAGDQFVVNGRPFNGTGFGFNPASEALDGIDPGPDGGYGNAGVDDDGAGVDDDGDGAIDEADEVDNLAEAGWPGSDDVQLTALRPNRFLKGTASHVTAYQGGGPNESYDVADYNNLALAAMIDDGSLVVLPSFHRPALVNFWFHWVSANWLTPAVPAEEHLAIFLQPYGFDNILGNNPATGVNDDPQQGVLTPTQLRQIAELKRDIILRPLPEFNPNFTGSTTAFGNIALDAAGAQYRTDYQMGGSAQANAFLNNPYVRIPYDLDNDGDGVADSIWVDLDFPVQTGADGRMVKPLLAFLITDLDGRLNLNAHGSLSHLPTRAFPDTTATTNLAGGVSSSTMPEGLGYGPPEINLASLFGDQAQYETLLRGRQSGSYRIPGRYGIDATNVMVPGRRGADTLASLKFFEFPQDYFDRANNPSLNLRAFQSPPDLRGELAFGLDHRGMPTYERGNATAALPGDLVSDNPYEINLDQNAARGSLTPNSADAPFSLAELERLVRYRDHDALMLPSRLLDLYPSLPAPATSSPFVDSLSGSVALQRRLVTTDSYDLPVPNLYLPGLGTLPRHATDIFRRQLIRGFGWTSSSITAQMDSNLSGQMLSLVSPDLIMGQRMDVNRPFGNGQDDAYGSGANGVVDEHGVTTGAGLEASLNERVWRPTISFDHDNDGVTGTDSDAFLARQHYARHLYLLMMALKPVDFQIDLDGTPPATPATRADRIETAHAIAQWVINVVEFRDADSLMTPFEFDTHPFTPQPGPDGGWGVAGNDDDGDGTNDNIEEAMWPGSDDIAPWGVDGVLNTADDTTRIDRGLVWGCERPELLLSSTLAFHDRRTEDLSTPGGLASDAMMPDGMRAAGEGNYDQRLRPRGSLFIELYNPWASDSERVPAEFYRNNANTAQPGVVLNKVAPGGAPVWRMTVVTGASHNAAGEPLDPDNPAATPAFQIGDVERGIYFADPSALPLGGGHGSQRHYPSSAIAPLMPGRYAVVGSAGVRVGGDFVTTIGRRTDSEDDGQTNMMTDLKIPDTQRIVLTPDTDPSVHQVTVVDNYGNVDRRPAVIQPTIAVPIDTAQELTSAATPRPPKSLNLSVSEPLNGYPDMASGSIFDPALASGEGAYVPTLDHPLDLGRGLALESDGTTINYKTIYLQRLANPLLPFHAVLNPYRTVDRMRVDLTTFNGVRDPNSAAPPIDEAPFVTANQRAIRFNSTQRGLGNPARKLWKQLSYNPVVPTPLTADQMGADNHVFSRTLGATLGYLNQAYQGMLSASDGVAAQFYGAPDTSGSPFPWLTWNNRPFVSQYEMLQVPKSSSSKLLQHYDTLNSAYGAMDDPYGVGQPAHFAHLLNFFESSNPGGVGGDLYRLFDFTGVPSRFVGTETILNPQTFASGTGTELRHAPFNRISNFRDPGKINLNTINHSLVWNCLRGNDPHRTGGAVAGQGPSFRSFADARRGYDGHNSSSMISFDKDIPTLFARPFRGAGDGRLVPVPNMAGAGVAGTLLRNDASISGGGAGRPLFTTNNTASHVNTIRNPYFRYQSLQRLGNLVTTRSNVYAVWVTLGYFEVDPVTGTLGQEAGLNTGDVKRHRAFYVIDRSIPVAFEPGENHNVDRAVRIRRFIE